MDHENVLLFSCFIIVENTIKIGHLAFLKKRKS